MNKEPTEDPRAAAQDAIARAVDAAHDAYWKACDAEGRAIEPADLDAPEGFLDAAYDAALMVEGIADADGLPWIEAREFV